MIRQQHWPQGLMPSASQLQTAGQHRLVAAIRQRGGFKTIAAQMGLTPRRLDKRGRKPKKPAAEQSAALSVEPVPHASVEAGHHTMSIQPRDTAIQHDANAHVQVVELV